MTMKTLQLLLLTDLVADLPVAVRLQRLVGTLRTHFRCGAVALLQLESGREHLRPVAVSSFWNGMSVPPASLSFGQFDPRVKTTLDVPPAVL